MSKKSAHFQNEIALSVHNGSVVQQHSTFPSRVMKLLSVFLLVCLRALARSLERQKAAHEAAKGLSERANELGGARYDYFIV